MDIAEHYIKLIRSAQRTVRGTAGPEDTLLALSNPEQYERFLRSERAKMSADYYEEDSPLMERVLRRLGRIQ